MGPGTLGPPFPHPWAHWAQWAHWDRAQGSTGTRPVGAKGSAWDQGPCGASGGIHVNTSPKGPQGPPCGPMRSPGLNNIVIGITLPRGAQPDKRQ